MHVAVPVPEDAEQPFALCVIVASLGGVQAVPTVLTGIARSTPIALAVLIHRSEARIDALCPVLARRTMMRVRLAEEDDAIENGTVYVARAGVHLKVNPGGFFGLSSGPRVHYVRPSGDVLLVSAAAVLRQRLIAVILTGNGADGADGVREVKRLGGTTIAQNPEHAESPSMPKAAIATRAIDLVLPLSDIGGAIQRLAAGR